MTRFAPIGLVAATILCSATGSGLAQQAPSGPPKDRPSDPPRHGAMGAPSGHDHGAAPPALRLAELQRTAEQLSTAKQATAKYQDVRAAEAAGYRSVGPNVPGMGVHYVRETGREGFEIGNPPILLYERDPSVPGGLRLTGVSYLLVAPAGDDGQPATSPFPRALARWHKHNNVCVLPDRSATVSLSEPQCTGKGGRFTAETSWMVHAWIWKDSPSGVFSPINPLVR